MSNKETAKEEIRKFLAVYEKHLAERRFESQKEANTEKYVESLFEKLGWDRLTDLERQHNIKNGEVDYSVNFGGASYFLIEVKKYKEELDRHRKQAIDYAFQSGQKWVVLTNLREIRVYNAQYQGQPEEIIRLFRPIKIDELVERFEDLWVLSKEGAESNLIEKRAVDMSKVKIKEPITILSKALLDWRSLLTKEMKSHPRLNEISGKDKEEANEWVDEAVQMLLNRFIFLRTIEDLGQWKFSIRTILNKWKEKKDQHLMEYISNFFKEVNAEYNAGLFAKHPCEELTIADHVLAQVIEEMYLNKENDLEWDFKALASDQDILGLAYEQYLGTTLTEKTARVKQSKEKRKSMGIYYTPKYIVEYIVENTLGTKLKEAKKWEDLLKIKVLDPACGSGSFLKEAYRLFKEKIKREGWGVQTYFDKDGQQMSVYDAILKNCIHGVDLDRQACEMAKLNLLIMAAEGGTHQLPNLDWSIQRGNSLIDDPAIAGDKAFKWEERFKEIISEGGFDMVVGNPPYISFYSRMAKFLDEKTRVYYAQNYSVVKNAYARINSVQLFFERAVKICKDGGYIGLIVDKTILEEKSNEFIRDYLLTNATILKIVPELRDTFGATVDVVILILKKSKNKNSKIDWITNPDINIKLKITKIDQNNFLKNKRKEFLVDSLGSIGNKIEKDSKLLTDVCILKSGANIGGHSKEFLFNYKKNNKCYPVLKGSKNVGKYNLRWSDKDENSYLNYDHELQYSINKRLEKISKERGIKINLVKLGDGHIDKRFEKPKLIIRQSASKLTATYDDKKFYILYGLFLLNKKDPNIDLKYVLALINSKLLSYYALKKKIILTGNKKQPQIRSEGLKRLKIKCISPENQKQLVKLVDKILSLNKHINEIKDKTTDEKARLEKEIQKVDDEMDQEVYKIYGLTKEEIKIVEDSIKEKR